MRDPSSGLAGFQLIHQAPDTVGFAAFDDLERSGTVEGCAGVSSLAEFIRAQLPVAGQLERVLDDFGLLFRRQVVHFFNDFGCGHDPNFSRATGEVQVFAPTRNSPRASAFRVFCVFRGWRSSRTRKTLQHRFRSFGPWCLVFV